MFAFLERTSVPGTLSLISNTPLVFLLFIIVKSSRRKKKKQFRNGTKNIHENIRKINTILYIQLSKRKKRKLTI